MRGTPYDHFVGIAQVEIDPAKIARNRHINDRGNKMKQPPIDLLPLDLAREQSELLDRLRQLKVSADHWNAEHPDEEPITIDLDLSKDAPKHGRSRLNARRRIIEVT